jgi:hypothetical protein
MENLMIMGVTLAVKIKACMYLPFAMFTVDALPIIICPEFIES